MKLYLVSVLVALITGFGCLSNVNGKGLPTPSESESKSDVTSLIACGPIRATAKGL